MQDQPQSDLLIGVDGGGTQCRFALMHAGKRTEVVRGPANVSTDLFGAILTLSEGFEALTESAGLSSDSIKSARVYMGLAGVLCSKATQKLSSQLIFEHVVIDDDRTTATVGALGKNDGAVFGIGTGSFFGRQKNGKVALRGGWGFILGDDASGADLGRKALKRSLSTIDGDVDASDLTSALLREFGGSAAIVDFAASARPSEFAKYAPRIVEAARAGDKAGIAIMAEGAALIEYGIRSLGWKPGERLCPTGGLAPHYIAFMHDELAQYTTKPDGTALDGSLALAARIGERTFFHENCKPH